MKTNLQKFAILLTGEDGLDEFILENFNNQDADKYEFDGEIYEIFGYQDVKDQLDEDFESEIYDFAQQCERIDYTLAQLIEKVINYEYNYKTVENDYDKLLDYDFMYEGEDIYLYIKKQ